jgi:hypothetical protein
VHDLVPITLLVGLFTWLIVRRYCSTQEKLQLAAIERGLLNLPAPAQHDGRRTAWVLIALGAGFGVAAHVTLSLSPEVEVSPLAVSIWGLVPVLVGVALGEYHRRSRKEREAQGAAA